MTYREILKLYKQGKLEEAKQKEIEADIEKQDAISEYLFEEDTIPDIEFMEENNEGAEETEAEQDSRFLKMINQSIKRAFIKMGVTVGAVVLIIVLLIVFALPGFVSLFYYDPGKIIGKNPLNGIKTNQVSLDMAVYTELFVPGYYRSRVEVDDLGYGKYDICIKQETSINGFFTDLSGKINKNHMLLYDTNVIKRPVQNVFMRTEETEGLPFTSYENEETGEIEYGGPAGTPENAKEELQELDEKDYYIAYVTLDRITEYEKFMKWLETLELSDPWRSGYLDDAHDKTRIPFASSNFLWCSVYLEDAHGTLPAYNIGFMTHTDNYNMCFDEEEYPGLCYPDIQYEVPDKEEAQAHFLSILKYMSRQKRFLKMMGEEESVDYNGMIELVKKNGLQLNGFAVVAKKAELLDLAEDERVCYIYTVPMR